MKVKYIIFEELYYDDVIKEEENLPEGYECEQEGEVDMSEYDMPFSPGDIIKEWTKKQDDWTDIVIIRILSPSEIAGDYHADIRYEPAVNTRKIK